MEGAVEGAWMGEEDAPSREYALLGLNRKSGEKGGIIYVVN